MMRHQLRKLHKKPVTALGTAHKRIFWKEHQLYQLIKNVTVIADSKTIIINHLFVPLDQKVKMGSQIKISGIVTKYRREDKSIDYAIA